MRTGLITALVPSQLAVGLIFVDFGDDVWKSADIQASQEGEKENYSVTA